MMGFGVRSDLYSSEKSKQNVTNESGKRKVPHENILLSNKKARKDPLIYCVCNLFYDDGNMVICAKCKMKQHMLCMKLDMNNAFFCETCNPQPVDSGPTKKHEPNVTEMSHHGEKTTDRRISTHSKKTNPNKTEIIQQGKTFSNSMRDAVQTTCKICNNNHTLTAMRSHTRKFHNVAISTYKETYGQLEIVKPIYHKCGICTFVMILDSDIIKSHLRVKHSMTHANYNAQFMVTAKRNQSQNTRQKDKIPGVKLEAITKLSTQSKDDLRNLSTTQFLQLLDKVIAVL